MNESHIRRWKEIDEFGVDREEYLVNLIVVSLLTREQSEWLLLKNLSIPDLLNGRTSIDLGETIHRVFYRPWNDILQANGLKRSFSEQDIGPSLVQAVRENLGTDFRVEEFN